MDKEIAPAEPEVLWSVPYDPKDGWYAFQVRADGSMWYRFNGAWEEVNLTKSHPAVRELARRLVAERAEQEKLDDHNDELERRGQVLLEGRDRGASLSRVEASTDGLLAHYSEAKRRLDELEGRLAVLEKEDTDRVMLAGRVQELDANLAREIGRVALLESRSFRVNERLDAIEAKIAPPSLDYGVAGPSSPREVVAALRDSGIAEELVGRVQWWGGTAPGGIAWERGSNRMVDSEGKCLLDLSGYDNLSPKDHDLLEKLADLWSAWGPEGYLRELLANTPMRVGEWGGHPDFRQLRSELLAKPWKEGL